MHGNSISVATIFKVAVALLVAYILWQILDVLAVLFLAIVIASGLEPLIEFMGKYRISRLMAAVIIYLVVFFAMASFFYLMVPPLADDIVRFLADFPRIQSNFLQSDALESLPFYSVISQNLNTLSATGLDAVRKIGTSFLNFSTQLLGGIISVVLLIVISFYLSVQENGVSNFLKTVLPLEYEKYALEIWDRSRKKLGVWLRSMFILMAIVGALVYISLTIVGIKYAFLLGILAGIFELVPVVGPILAAVPGVALGALQSPTTGLIVLAVYVVVQQIENHVFVPLIMQKTIGLNPIIIIISLLIGGELGGVIGLLVAVPLATVIVEIIDDADRRRRVTA